jgi:hypothetical protein
VDQVPGFVNVLVSEFNAITILAKAMKLSGWIFSMKVRLTDRQRDREEAVLTELDFFSPLLPPSPPSPCPSLWSPLRVMSTKLSRRYQFIPSSVRS